MRLLTKLRRLISTQDTWSIGILSGGSPLDLRPPAGITNPVLDIRDVTDVRALTLADPFMCLVDDVWYMFFEVLNSERGLGEIGLAISSDGLRWSYQKVVLREAFHLSYPCVFQHEGDHYLIPDSYQSSSDKTSSVRLYRATAFPTDWSFVGELLGGSRFIDPTPFCHDGYWWILIKDTLGQTDVLRLFYATQLAGPWLEHRESPIVKGDRRRTRSAGRVISFDGTLLRLAQDCSHSYGQSIRSFRIKKLTPHSYREEELPLRRCIGGSGRGWNAKGMHHMDAHRLPDGRWIASVDGLGRVPYAAIRWRHWLRGKQESMCRLSNANQGVIS